MTPREALVDARALIATPETWGKGADACDFFRDRSGVLRAGSVLGQKRDRYCPHSAVIAATTAPLVASLAIARLNKIAPGGNATVFNDAPETTHAEVLALFDRAIAAESP